MSWVVRMALRPAVAADVVRTVVRVASEPARRLTLLWQAVSWSVAILFMILGSGYAVRGYKIEPGSTLRLLANIEPGGAKTHGVVLMSLALFIAYGMGAKGQVAKSALVAALFYSLLTSIMIFGSWIVYSVSWSAPWLYMLAAALVSALLILMPTRSLEGSERA